MSKGTKAALARSRSIDHQLEEERERKEREIQLLVLGGSGSGKSTLIKQVRLHHGDGFPSAERHVFLPYIVDNLCDAINVLHLQRKILGTPSGNLESEIDQFCNKYPRVSMTSLLMSTTPEASPTHNLCTALSTSLNFQAISVPLKVAPETERERPAIKQLVRLWTDKGLRESYRRRDEFKGDNRLAQAEEYFLSRLESMGEQNFVPTVADILAIRRPTLSVQEHIVHYNSVIFRIIDVAGQKSQRNKWIHFFEGVAAVLFLAALSGYNEILDEDPSTNSIHDSLETFRSVTHNIFLERASFILLLNKSDLFQAMLPRKSLRSCFPEYKGENSVQRCADFIRDKFIAAKLTNQRLFAHTICAIDVQGMKPVTEKILSTISELNLKKASSGF